jgi:primosomal protein N''
MKRMHENLLAMIRVEMLGKFEERPKVAFLAIRLVACVVDLHVHLTQLSVHTANQQAPHCTLS